MIIILHYNYIILGGFIRVCRFTQRRSWHGDSRLRFRVGLSADEFGAVLCAQRDFHSSRLGQYFGQRLEVPLERTWCSVRALKHAMLRFVPASQRVTQSVDSPPSRAEARHFRATFVRAAPEPDPRARAQSMDLLDICSRACCWPAWQEAGLMLAWARERRPAICA